MKISLCVVIFLLIVFSSSCSQQNVVENVMEIDQHSLSYYVGRGISSSSITVSEDDAMYVAYSFILNSATL